MTAERISAEYIPSILIVDDVPENLTIISDLLADRYRCRVAVSGAKALRIAATQPQPDLILLDVVMPEMDGYEVCRRLKADPLTRDIPVIFLTALDKEEDETQGFEVGGVDYITKPVTRGILAVRVEAQLVLLRGKRFLSHRNELLEHLVAERSRQLSSMQDVIIMAMASLAETRDNDTGAHIRRVQQYAKALGLALRENPKYRDALTDDVLDLLYKTSPLHDIGKVGVPDAILFKPDRLSHEEFDEMKQHSFLGGQALMEVEKQLAAPEAFVSMAHEIALYHHERWDGTGYPLGLKGEEIPLSARIVALADTYDALISRRVYKPPYALPEVRIIIERNRGKQFDPDIVDAFLANEDVFAKIARKNPDPDKKSGGRRTALRRLMVKEKE
ncbi:MAG: response regulator [Desulfovibrionaceae bacterium]|nr:response regulator [Desulfovibrionaceae bacterium]